MGLLSGIGKFVGGLVGGPIGSVAGGLLGGVADATQDRNAAKQALGDARYREDTQLVRLASQAKKAGFHPLEALRGGGLQQTTPHVIPPLATNAALVGAFDQIEEQFSGEAARERERKEFEHDLFVQDAKEKLAGGASQVVERTLRANKVSVGPTRQRSPAITAGKSGAIRAPVMTDQGEVPFEDIAAPTPIDPQTGTIDTNIDDGGTGVQLKPRDRVVLMNGRTVDITVGPDLDEMLTGFGVEAYDRARESARLWRQWWDGKGRPVPKASTTAGPSLKAARGR